jgi:hypothetical protein
MDYMSDDFLKAAAEPAPKRRHRGSAVQTQQVGKRKLQEQQEERREEGLQTALSADNKGYQLLQKFGFTEGQGLGRSGTGNKEPIKVQKRENNDR